MFLFLFVVLPLLCLFSLVIGMIYAYRKNQADGEEHIRNGTNQMAIKKSEEASEERKDIIYVSVCCASVLLFLTVCYFAFRNSATELIEYSEPIYLEVYWQGEQCPNLGDCFMQLSRPDKGKIILL